MDAEVVRNLAASASVTLVEIDTPTVMLCPSEDWQSKPSLAELVPFLGSASHSRETGSRFDDEQPARRHVIVAPEAPSRTSQRLVRDQEALDRDLVLSR